MIDLSRHTLLWEEPPLSPYALLSHPHPYPSTGTETGLTT